MSIIPALTVDPKQFVCRSNCPSGLEHILTEAPPPISCHLLSVCLSTGKKGQFEPTLEEIKGPDNSRYEVLPNCESRNG